jgi:hypothetical protein
MRLRFLTSCLAVLITASTGFCQDVTVKPAEPVRSVSPDPNAPTPARDIQLLNPDGTPATDAKVVAVLTTPGGIVDQDLKPRQVRKGDRQPLTELVNTNGTVKIIFDSTQAIVASNEQGFLFLPASAFGDTAKLRKWAHVELDVSTVPDDKRAEITLNVTWTNSLQGMYVRPQMNRDPFSDVFDRPEKVEPKPDWRFDPMITWTQSVPVTNRSVRVPPGEVMISLVSKQVNDETPFLVLPPGACAATVGLWQTPGGTVQHIALPEFGSVEGAIKTDTTSTLPDWSHSGSETMKFSLNHGPFADLPPILSHPGSNDEYFSNLASDEGFKARRDWAASSMTTSSDGSFRFPLVPVGTYSIHKLIETRKLPVGTPGQLAVVTVPLKPDGDGDNPSIVVNAKNTTVVSVTELRQPAYVPGSLPEIPGSGSPGPLPTGAEVAFREIRRMVDGREVTQVIPYVVYPQQGMPKDPSMLPSDPQTNGEVEMWLDPALLYEPDVAPAPDPKLDAVTTLIQNWLGTAKDPSDQAELRKLLQDHLQQEFEATQASRKAEVERLQRLLLQSVEWLDKRAKNRDEIIKKRIDELIQNSVTEKSATPK